MFHEESHLIPGWVTSKRNLKNKSGKYKLKSKIIHTCHSDLHRIQTYLLPVIEQPLPRTEPLSVFISEVLSELLSLTPLSLSPLSASLSGFSLPTPTRQCPHLSLLQEYQRGVCHQGPQKPSLKPDHKNKGPWSLVSPALFSDPPFNNCVPWNWVLWHR